VRSLPVKVFIHFAWTQAFDALDLAQGKAPLEFQCPTARIESSPLRRRPTAVFSAPAIQN